MASVVPAATDLIISMGAANHLVAVDDFAHDPRVAGLPRVGGYEQLDWEKLAQLRPDVLISWFGTNRMPGGFVQHAQELKIRVVNLKFYRLEDEFAAISQLGEACHEPDAAAALSHTLRDQIEQVRHETINTPRTTAAIVTGDSGQELAGRATYLDDLLTVAGGTNVVEASDYVTLDREALAALRPQVVFILLPGKDANAATRARAIWDSMADVPATKNHRVYVLTQDYIMQPGSHVGDVARIFAEKLHAQRNSHLQTSLPA